MDAEVWSDLPEEILRTVLARLPWWKNLQLRSVCKSWNSMLSNQSFLAKSLPAPCPRPPCIVLSTADEYAMVNFEMKRWNSYSQSSLLPRFRTADCFEISSATAGLFLMEGKYENLGRFLVNPLNKTQRQLPPVPPLENHSSNRGTSLHHPLRMTVNEKTHNVRIIGVQFQIQTLPVDMPGIGTVLAELWSIYVYDLFRNSWELVSKNLQREILLSLEYAIFVGDDLYLLTKQQSRAHCIVKAMATDLVKVPADFICNTPTVHIFEHQGVLMLVSGAEEKNPCVDIWKLENLTQKWEKVVSMPEHLVTKFYKSLPMGIFNFDAEGDFVCFANYFNAEIIVVYNLVEQLWWEVSCKNYIRQDLNFRDTFLWQPCLDIVL